jgi:hypothetical protein
MLGCRRFSDQNNSENARCFSLFFVVLGKQLTRGGISVDGSGATRDRVVM